MALGHCPSCVSPPPLVFFGNVHHGESTSLSHGGVPERPILEKCRLYVLCGWIGDLILAQGVVHKYWSLKGRLSYRSPKKAKGAVNHNM